MLKAIVLIAGLSIAGCAATVGTDRAVHVPKDAAASCSTRCHDIGLGLDSVVIMANNVGCVCGAAPSTAGHGATGAGMAALVVQQQQEEQERQHQQQDQHGRSSSPASSTSTTHH